MRLLVTGGAGFIGSNFIHHMFHAHASVPSDECCPDQGSVPAQRPLQDLRVLNVDKLTYAGKPAYLHGPDRARGYRFLQADVTDSKAMEQAFRSFAPEAVVHLAAETHVDRSIASGTPFVESNVLGTQVLLDAARRHDVRHFLHVSTDEVYGSIEKGSFRESDRLNPSSPYSASKAASDLLALAHHHTYGLPVTVSRCTNNYGPRQHGEKLVPLMVLRALRNERLPLYGTGRNVRDWLYVKDHATALERLLAQTPSGAIFHVAARDERTNLDVVRAILRHLGKPESLVEFVADRPGHDLRYSLDDHSLRSLGWAPRMGFEQGLRHTVEWVRRHAEVVAG